MQAAGTRGAVSLVWQAGRRSVRQRASCLVPIGGGETLTIVVTYTSSLMDLPCWRHLIMDFRRLRSVPPQHPRAVLAQSASRFG